MSQQQSKREEEQEIPDGLKAELAYHRSSLARVEETSSGPFEGLGVLAVLIVFSPILVPLILTSHIRTKLAIQRARQYS